MFWGFRHVIPIDLRRFLQTQILCAHFLFKWNRHWSNLFYPLGVISLVTDHLHEPLQVIWPVQVYMGNILYCNDTKITKINKTTSIFKKKILSKMLWHFTPHAHIFSLICCQRRNAIQLIAKKKRLTNHLPLINS